MKFSDLMLDMATGDASIHDVYIQESVGKINVSTAIFDAAYKISELPAGEFMIVQEAADAGLPTDPDKAAGVACEAVKQSLKAFYDLVVNTAKKVKQSAEKDMKALVAIGKKYGVSANGGNFVNDFVSPLCNAIAADNGKKLSLADKRFIKGKYAEEIAENYGTGMTNFLSAYGMEFDNSNLSQAFKPYKSKREINTFKDLKKNLEYGGKLIKFEKTIEKDKHYTSTVSVNDIKDLAVAIYEVLNVSKGVIDVAGSASAKKTAMATVDELCGKEDCEAKKVSKTLQAINEGIKDWTEGVTSITENITKAFTDSVYALSGALTGSAE